MNTGTATPPKCTEELWEQELHTNNLSSMERTVILAWRCAGGTALVLPAESQAQEGFYLIANIDC